MNLYIEASANSSCAQNPTPPLPPTHTHTHTHKALAFFLPWMANSWGWGLLSCQIPQGGDEKRGQMPHPPTALQHFSLTALSNSVILSILMCDFLFQFTSSFVIALGFQSRLHAAMTPVYSLVIKLLTLKLIVHCKVICYVIKYARIFFK